MNSVLAVHCPRGPPRAPPPAPCARSGGVWEVRAVLARGAGAAAVFQANHELLVTEAIAHAIDTL